MISVIVPVYNTEKYLNRCIESIISQSYTDLELLLIDDGSLDCSGRICDEYAAKDTRVRVFHKSNGGVSSARNLGIDKAKGEWIAFVDSDDYIHIDYLKELYALRDAELIVGSYQMVGTDTPINGVIPTNTYLTNQLKETLLHYGETGNFRGAMCKMYKRDIINKEAIRYDENMSASEDWLFALEYIAYVHKIRTLDKPYYYYEQENVDGLSKHVRNFDTYFYAMEQFYYKVHELESKLNVTGLDPLFLDITRVYIRRQVQYLYYNKKDNYREKLRKIKKMLNNPYVQLVLEDKTRCKSRKKFRIFDFIALKKLYALLLLYILIYKGRAY